MRLELEDKPIDDPEVMLALSRLRLLARGHYPGVSVPEAVLCDIRVMLSLVQTLTVTQATPTRLVRACECGQEATIQFKCPEPLLAEVGRGLAEVRGVEPLAG